MSNVLKALKKSEQGHKALENAKAMHMHYEQSPQSDRPDNKHSGTNKDRKIVWVSFTLFILPCIIMIIILLQEKQTVTTSATAIPDIVMDSIDLPYPNLESLEPLPKPEPREVVIVSSVDQTGDKNDKFNDFASLINTQGGAGSSASTSTSTSKANSKASSKPSANKGSNNTSQNSNSNSSSKKPSSNKPNSTGQGSNGKSSGENIENIDLSEVSPELAALFQQAVSENTQQPAKKNPSASDFEHPVINLIGNEGQFNRKLPAMNLETHIYTSRKEPWVKINGSNLKEKDWLPNSDVRVEKILPGSLIIYFDGKYIQIPALYEWKG